MPLMTTIIQLFDDKTCYNAIKNCSYHSELKNLIFSINFVPLFISKDMYRYSWYFAFQSKERYSCVKLYTVRNTGLCLVIDFHLFLNKEQVILIKNFPDMMQTKKLCKTKAIPNIFRLSWKFLMKSCHICLPFAILT